MERQNRLKKLSRLSAIFLKEIGLYKNRKLDFWDIWLSGKLFFPFSLAPTGMQIAVQEDPCGEFFEYCPC